MKTITKTDLEDLSLLLEDLVKRLPDMKRGERIDVAARVRTVRKHIESIEETVKAEIKASRRGKEGYVMGEVFKAKLTLVPVNRLDQKALKEGNPRVYNEYVKETQDQRITWEPR